MNYTRKLFALALAVITAGSLAACSSDPLSSGSNTGGGSRPAAGGGSPIVVGSANFPESIILGELYAKALESKGFTVDRKLNIGAREVYFQQLQSCSIDFMPDYNQALLAFLDPKTTASGTEAVDKALAAALPASLTALTSADAQDNNSVAVTKATADANNLKTIPDLAKVSSDWVFGGPTEWEARTDGYLGLKDKYGVTFKEYRVLDYSGPITISALTKGGINAALLFSTTPEIVANDLVVLKDPDNVIGVNNITPVVCKDHVNSDAKKVINDVTAKLTTDGLTKMNASYVIDKQDANAVAANWLSANGLTGS